MPTPEQKILGYIHSDPVLQQYRAIFAQMSLDDAANVASGTFPGTTRIKRENGETLIETEPRIEFLASGSPLFFMAAGLVAKGYQPRMTVRLGQVPGRIYNAESKLDDYALRGFAITCASGEMRVDVREHDLRNGMGGIHVDRAMLKDDLELRMYQG